MPFLYTTVDAALEEPDAQIPVHCKNPDDVDIAGYIQLDQLVSASGEEGSKNKVLLHVIFKFLLDNPDQIGSIEFTSDLLKKTFSLVGQPRREGPEYEYEEKGGALETPNAQVSAPAA